jgi:hypothetical protein
LHPSACQMKRVRTADLSEVDWLRSIPQEILQLIVNNLASTITNECCVADFRALPRLCACDRALSILLAPQLALLLNRFSTVNWCLKCGTIESVFRLGSPCGYPLDDCTLFPKLSLQKSGSGLCRICCVHRCAVCMRGSCGCATLRPHCGRCNLFLCILCNEHALRSGHVCPHCAHPLTLSPL